jgi:uncharacterized protein YndB with AHSA1/START domain
MTRLIATLVLLAGLSLQASTAGARMLHSSAAGFTIENTVTVPVDAKVAWNALVKDVDRWWPKDHSWFGKEGKFSIEPRAGGCFCEKAGARQAQHMTVSFVEPGATLRMIGGLGPLQGLGLDGVMDWTFTPSEGGTKITLRYVAGGYTTTDLVQFAPVVDRVQGQQLGGLAAFLSRM